MKNRGHFVVKKYYGIFSIHLVNFTHKKYGSFLFVAALEFELKKLDPL